MSSPTKAGNFEAGDGSSDKAAATPMIFDRPVLRFAIVGGAGFAIESIIVTLLMQAAQVPAWQARIPSFVTAVVATWLLNRRFTFLHRDEARSNVKAVVYAATQLCGAAINFVLFVAMVHWYPNLASVPVIPLGVGAVAGFAFNFLICDELIFRKRTEIRNA
jgi:putative flippase GtrA